MGTAGRLTDLRYHVIEAGSAEVAPDLLQHGVTADLLVTDHLMLGMSGTDLARAARELKPWLPILTVSCIIAGVSAAIARRASSPGASADLAVPRSGIGLGQIELLMRFGGRHQPDRFLRET